MKRKLALLLALCICISALCGLAMADVADAGDGDGAAALFPDVPETAPYAEAVNALREYGIISGDDKGNFNPDSSVTRAEAAVIICRLLGMSEDAQQASTTAFSDVPVDHWANGYVAKAAEQGIINGYGNGKFGPSDSVTYAQMIKMLVCAWGMGQQAEAEGGYPSGYMLVAENTGITTGINYSTDNAAPRHAVALLVYNSMFR